MLHIYVVNINVSRSCAACVLHVDMSTPSAKVVKAKLRDMYGEDWHKGKSSLEKKIMKEEAAKIIIEADAKGMTSVVPVVSEQSKLRTRKRIWCQKKWGKKWYDKAQPARNKERLDEAEMALMSGNTDPVPVASAATASAPPPPPPEESASSLGKRDLSTRPPPTPEDKQKAEAVRQAAKKSKREANIVYKLIQIVYHETLVSIEAYARSPPDVLASAICSLLDEFFSEMDQYSPDVIVQATRMRGSGEEKSAMELLKELYERFETCANTEAMPSKVTEKWRACMDRLGALLPVSWITSTKRRKSPTTPAAGVVVEGGAGAPRGGRASPEGEPGDWSVAYQNPGSPGDRWHMAFSSFCD